MNILAKILETKRRELTAAKAARGFDDMLSEARAVTRPVISLADALAGSPTGIIAEFKRRSPSKGTFSAGADAAAIVAGYARNGAAAISVLTDRDYFGGSPDDLRAARKAAPGIPLLRKDFVIDPYQLCAARVDGADAVLLIAAALTLDECRDLASFAVSLGLEALLEIHDESELGHINEHIALVGVNNRNLSTFATDIEVSKRLGRLLPEGILQISESGISSPEAVRELCREGFRGFLMGEHFMRQPDPAAALGTFIKLLSA